MPLDIIKMLKVVHKNCDEVTITLERADQTRPDLITGGTIQVYGGAVISWKAVDGQFPDYIRVLPKDPMTGETAQYDPAIVQKFVKAAKYLGLTPKNGVPIGHNGGGGALIDLGEPNFIGVIMPMRVEPVNATPTRFLTRLA
jgi:DNA polymerase III sliding clamp (beta) subunit (PCNA family)